MIPYDFAEELGLDDHGLIGQNTLSKHLEVTVLGHVNYQSFALLGAIGESLPFLSRDKERKRENTKEREGG